MPSDLLCFADISMDVLIRVSHLPQPDEKQWASVIGEYPGGMGANVAAAHVTLGGSAGLVTRVGMDSRGDVCLENLRSVGVDLSHVTRVPDPTFWTFSLLDDGGEKSMVEFASPALSPDWSDLRFDLLEGARAVYTTGYEAPHALDLFRRCRARDILTVLDLETAEPSAAESVLAALACTDVLFCRMDGVRAFTRAQTESEGLQEMLALGPSTVVLTRGAGGSVIASSGAEPIEIRGIQVDAVDTTGAGDCYVGAFTYGLLLNWPLETCGEIASLMAAMSVTTHGCRSNLLHLSELLALPQAAHLKIPTPVSA